MGRLDGKVAIVTGAARGQGEAEARRFVAEGAKVLLTDVLDDDGRAVADDLGDAAGLPAPRRHLGGRVARRSRRRGERFGPVTVLVNNAGILDFSPVEKQDVEKFRRVVDVNLTGTMLGMKSVVPSMRRAGGGSIVNISSNSGIWGIPMAAAYCSSKWAVRGLSKAGALELGRHGIRVNSVHPGGVDTPMVRMPGYEPNDTGGRRTCPWAASACPRRSPRW